MIIPLTGSGKSDQSLYLTIVRWPRKPAEQGSPKRSSRLGNSVLSGRYQHVGRFVCLACRASPYGIEGSMFWWWYNRSNAS